MVNQIVYIKLIWQDSIHFTWTFLKWALCEMSIFLSHYNAQDYQERKKKQLKIRCDKCKKIYQFYSLVDKSSRYLRIERLRVLLRVGLRVCFLCVINPAVSGTIILPFCFAVLFCLVIFFLALFFLVLFKLIQLLEYFAMRMLSANNIVNKT